MPALSEDTFRRGVAISMWQTSFDDGLSNLTRFYEKKKMDLSGNSNFWDKCVAAVQHCGPKWRAHRMALQ